MAKNQTVETKASVSAYVAKLVDEAKRKDCATIIKLMEEESGLKAKMWGPAIVGFGSYHYVYESGREGDAPLIAFSARANAISLYLPSEFEKREELLPKLGKHKTAKACIYIKKLADIDQTILVKMIRNALAHQLKKQKLLNKES
jgi:hypothetical protein